VATMLHVRSANLVELAAGLPRESDRWDMGYQWISQFLANDLVCCDTVIEPFAREILAQLAMNLDIALPHEQTHEQNRRLMQDFVREQFQRKGYAAHFAIHPPDREGDERNIHAHVLVTLRKIDENGFARTKAEQQERYRNRGEFVEGLRESWERLANRHLERNGYEARIDRRSLQEQGIEREPEQHRGPAVTAMERDGNVTRIGDQIRRRQHYYAELKALAVEERQIDAELISLEAARAEREARTAARGQVDDIRPDQSRDFAASQTAPEAVQTREAPAAASAPEQTNTRSTEPQQAAEEIFSREARPAREAPRVIHLGPPADELGHAAEKGVEAVAGLFDGAASLVERTLDYLSDFIAPPPPPTKEQAEAMQRAAEERRADEAARREQAEKDARLRELLEQIRRNDEQKRYDRYTGRSRDDDDDYDRGRERERSR